MATEQIKNWIKEAHENMIGKGFYDCPECGGSGEVADNQTDYMAGERSRCLICDGTGIDPSKDIGDLLMGIVSELGKALEAYKCKRICSGKRITDFREYKGTGFYSDYEISLKFESIIKDTHEDKIADAMICLFDLCGYLGIEQLNPEYTWKCYIGNVGHHLLNIVEAIVESRTQLEHSKFQMKEQLENILHHLLEFSLRFSIPIENYIDAKMAYNKTRSYNQDKDIEGLLDL